MYENLWCYITKFYHQIDDSGQLGKLLERLLKRMRCLYFIYSRSGFVQLNTEVPDTLTTWYSEAYGLHSATGLGVARQSQITVVKPFFVSLELPFSVNFGRWSLSLRWSSTCTG